MANYLGRAGAYALHKKYPSGQQSSAQLAAERANLQRARMAKGQFRHTTAALYRGLRKSSLKSRESAASVRLFNMRDIAPSRARALGVRYMRYKARATPPKPTIRGIPKRFVAHVGPGHYMGRTRWGSARTHRFRARLFKRSRRARQVKRWKNRGHRYTPR
jgi:hypothetical protein